MKYLELSFTTPEENLACDEALLMAAEEGRSGEVLRIWESSSHFVVLGYSSKTDEDVNRDACSRESVKVLRRTSGGGTVVQGPGCLNYALILEIEGSEHLGTLTRTNEWLMSRHAAALQPLAGEKISVKGITDLALDSVKFSGNAQRRMKRFLLFHGTFLVDFDLTAISRLLKNPPRQPEYRAGRDHGDFLMNLAVCKYKLADTLKEEWGADGVPEVPAETMRGLIRDKYGREEWNFKF